MSQTRRIAGFAAALAVVVAGCNRAPKQHFNKGIAYFKEEKFAKAAAHFEKALAGMQTNASALNFLGVCKLQAGDAEAGAQLLQEALRLDSGYVPARYNLALAHLEGGRAETAIEELRQVAQSGKAPADVEYQLGRAYLRGSAWAQAEQALAKYAKTATNSAEILNCLGVVSARQREYKQAAQYFERSLAADPKHEAARRNLAFVQRQEAGQKREPPVQPKPVAIAQPAPTPKPPELAKPVVAETPAPKPPVAPAPAPEQPADLASAKPAPPAAPAPPTPPVKKRRIPATATLKAGNRQKAVPFFNDGVKLQQQGNLTGAITAYRKAIAADAAYASAYYNLAIAYREARQPDNALSNYELALIASPEYTDARFNYAILLQEQGYYDDAIAQYERILQMNPNDATAHLSVANLYARDRATQAKAREHYQAFVRLAPDSPLARDIRRWLEQNR
jgi:tetratricopeptide (TPR) repeat protein